MLRRMKTMSRSAEVDQDDQAMVDKGQLFGIYLVLGVILGLLWFVSATFGMIAGAWGMAGAVVLWKMR
jgi:hypothetical protein